MNMLVAIRKNIIKVLKFLLLIFPVMFFLNSGFSLDLNWKVVQAVIFTIIFTVIIIWPQVKKFVFYLSLVLIIFMAIFYTLRLIELADITGSTGIGLIMINLVAYLPQLVKLGYIKKL